MRSTALLLLCVAAAAARADDGSHPLTLWRVDGGTNAVYLIGSIHLLRPEDHT